MALIFLVARFNRKQCISAGGIDWEIGHFSQGLKYCSQQFETNIINILDLKSIFLNIYTKPHACNVFLTAPSSIEWVSIYSSLYPINYQNHYFGGGVGGGVEGKNLIVQLIAMYYNEWPSIYGVDLADIWCYGYVS